jgi:hypothetical protein
MFKKLSEDYQNHKKALLWWSGVLLLANMLHPTFKGDANLLPFTLATGQEKYLYWALYLTIAYHASYIVLLFLDERKRFFELEAPIFQRLETAISTISVFKEQASGSSMEFSALARKFLDNFNVDLAELKRQQRSIVDQTPQTLSFETSPTYPTLLLHSISKQHQIDIRRLLDEIAVPGTAELSGSNAAHSEASMLSRNLPQVLSIIYETLREPYLMRFEHAINRNFEKYNDNLGQHQRNMADVKEVIAGTVEKCAFELSKSVAVLKGLQQEISRGLRVGRSAFSIRTYVLDLFVPIFLVGISVLSCFLDLTTIFSNPVAMNAH